MGLSCPHTIPCEGRNTPSKLPSVYEIRAQGEGGVMLAVMCVHVTDHRRPSQQHTNKHKNISRSALNTSPLPPPTHRVVKLMNSPRIGRICLLFHNIWVEPRQLV